MPFGLNAPQDGKYCCEKQMSQPIFRDILIVLIFFNALLAEFER